MERWKGGYGLTTNGEADWLIAEWKKERNQAEFGFASGIFNLYGETTPEPKPKAKEPKAEKDERQLELF